MHALRECDWVRKRWRNCEEKDLFEKGEGKSCFDWIKEVMNEFPEERIQKLCSILWYPWKERCNHKFNNRKMEEDEIIPRALGWLSSFLASHDSLNPDPRGDLMRDRSEQDCRWTPPPEGIYKLNSDDGVIKDQWIGVGCIIRDCRGEFVGAMAKKEKGVCRFIEEEAKALVMGLREANWRELSPLIVETDCQVLVNQLKKGDEDRTELGFWCDELKVLAKVNESLSGREARWEFRPRKTNSVVHWLAHIGLRRDQQVVWVDNPPLSLSCMIEADMGHGP